ncbi:hypothetical protein A2U01_0036140, partial [Trifolium medium]|nr:hypothetical protein [Trifolium medium]
FDDYKNKYALQKKLITDLETTETKLADVVKDRDALLVRVKELEEKISGMEEKLKSAEVTLIGEEEKKADPTGVYTECSRTELITKVFEVEGSVLEAASSQFHNAVAQLRILNLELIVEGLDEDKDVRDGRIATPSRKEEN